MAKGESRGGKEVRGVWEEVSEGRGMWRCG